MMPVTKLRARMVRALSENTPRADSATGVLRAALAEAAERPGHLARAGLVLASAEAAGMPAAEAERLACAVEFWHLASLLLDDLPCMDNAVVRRGRTCLHRVHGEAATILVALAFINRAYTLTGEVFATRPEAVRREALSLVETVMGPGGLVGGQAADLSFADSRGGASEVSRIAWRKTGALLWLSLALPALWNGPGSEQRRRLRRVAIYWGLAYQAMDDVSDLLCTSAEAGKTAQRDAILARPNLALVLGLSATQHRITRLLARAQRMIMQIVVTDPRQMFLARWHETMFVTRQGTQRAA